MIQSLAKGLDLLEFVALAETPVRLRDVAAHFNLERSSALRVLDTLEKSGFLLRYARSKSYAAGPRLSAILRRQKSHSQLVAQFHPHLTRLSDATGMSASLGVLAQDRVLLIDNVLAPGVISVNSRNNGPESLYPSAVGKAILAFLPDDVVEQLIEMMDFEPLTANTITSAAALRDVLAKVRLQGVSFDDGEANENVCCIAAPVLDGDGRPIAAIGISGVRALVRGDIRAQAAWIDAVLLAATQAAQ